MSEKYPISVTVNGEAHQEFVESRLLLVHFIRENLNLTGTHIGFQYERGIVCPQVS